MAPVGLSRFWPGGRTVPWGGTVGEPVGGLSGPHPTVRPRG